MPGPFSPTSTMEATNFKIGIQCVHVSTKVVFVRRGGCCGRQNTVTISEHIRLWRRQYKLSVHWPNEVT